MFAACRRVYKNTQTNRCSQQVVVSCCCSKLTDAAVHHTRMQALCFGCCRAQCMNAGASETTHRLGGDHRLELVELLEHAGHALVAVVVNRVLYDAYGVVRPLVQVGPDLLEDVLRHVVEGVVREHLCSKGCSTPWLPGLCRPPVHRRSAPSRCTVAGPACAATRRLPLQLPWCELVCSVRDWPQPGGGPAPGRCWQALKALQPSRLEDRHRPARMASAELSPAVQVCCLALQRRTCVLHGRHQPGGGAQQQRGLHVSVSQADPGVPHS